MGAKKKRCVVPGCGYFAVTGDGRTVFHFPSNPVSRFKWIQNVGCADLLNTKLQTIMTSRFVCPAHFEPCMFRDKWRDHLQRSPAVVPTLFKEGHCFLTDAQMSGWDASNSATFKRSKSSSKHHLQADISSPVVVVSFPFPVLTASPNNS